MWLRLTEHAYIIKIFPTFWDRLFISMEILIVNKIMIKKQHLNKLSNEACLHKYLYKFSRCWM